MSGIASQPQLDNDAILTMFLSYRLSRFVRKVHQETMDYIKSPSVKGRPGYLKRDRVASKLAARAYKRYNQAI